MKRKVVLIAAIAKNYVSNKGYPIGRNGKLLWSIPEDLKRFKELTKRHTVIMGRKTYESIPEKYRPLRDRINIVLTKNKNYKEKGIITVHSLEEALGVVDKISSYKSYFFINTTYVIGGESVYKQAMPLADCLEITLVDQTVLNADSFFPKIGNEWLVKKVKKCDGYSFITYCKGRK